MGGSKSEVGPASGLLCPCPPRLGYTCEGFSKIFVAQKTTYAWSEAEIQKLSEAPYTKSEFPFLPANLIDTILGL